MEKLHGHTLEYWKNNAEEDYLKVPISVLKYITCLEERIEQLTIPVVVGQSEQFKCHSCGTNHSGKNDDQLFEICKTCFDGI
jgi:hypothetical protein